MRKSDHHTTLTLVCLLALVAGAAAAQPTPAGDDFQVNTYTTDSQGSPDVAMAADGDFVAVWSSFAQDGDASGVFGQLYGSDGSPVGGEFQVNDYTTSRQSSPVIAADADGDFVVVWDSLGQDGSSFGVFGQRYDSAGSPIGGEFQINTNTTNAQFISDVAMDADGDFIVVWEDRDNPDGDRSAVIARRFASNGSPVGGEFIVNTYTTRFQGSPAVAMDPDGDFVVVWDSDGGQDGDDRGVFGQRFDSSGPVGSEFQVNTVTAGDQEDPSVAMDADGNFLVVWTDTGTFSGGGSDGSGAGIAAQAYAADGSPVGGEFVVNTYTTGDQEDPAVAVDAGGDFLVTWATQGSTAFSIAGQLVSGGTPVGSEFQVATYTTGDQQSAAVAAGPAGSFVVGWSNGGNRDGDGTGIFARLFATPDSDGDGIPDDEDECPDSNLEATVIVDGCDSGVDNVLFDNGCTITDLVYGCADGASNHGQFVSCVAALTNELKRDGVISGRDKGRIQSCAAQADLP